MSHHRLIGCLAAVAATILMLAAASTASAAGCGTPLTTLPGSCFSGGDGDQAEDGGGVVDWQSSPYSATPAIADGTGQADTKFAGGDKELEPGKWDFITQNNTPKTDLLSAWATMDGTFLYGSFVRAKQTGDTFLAFELNQDGAGPRQSGGYPVPHRSTGDVLLTYDILTTNKVNVGMCTWDGDENAGQWLRLDGTPVSPAHKRCTQLNPTTTPAAQGNVNWNNPINPNYLSGYGSSIGAGQFGEVAVNLGALAGRFLSDPCGDNGWVWLHSRASDSVTSQPKDLVTGQPFTSPTCDLTIDKSANVSAAHVGDPVTYTITVGNPGTADLTINVSDNKCSPLVGPNGEDGVNDSLAAGQSISYTCTRNVADTDPDPLVNTACTTGTATLGAVSTTIGIAPPICDQAVVDIVPADQVIPPPGGETLVAGENVAPAGQIVLGERITPGRARLIGPTGCQSRAFHARIKGTRVAKVVFTLDGKRIKTLRKVNFHKTFAVRLDPSRMRIGVHRLVATVTFQKGTGSKAKKFRLSFQRCARKVAAPQFTG